MKITYFDYYKDVKIKDFNKAYINTIEDYNLRQAIFFIKSFFDISFGNLIFGNDETNYYYSFPYDEITINDIYDLLYNKNIKSPYFTHSSTFGHKRRTENASQVSGFVIDVDYYTKTKYKDLSAEQLVEVMKSEGAFDLVEPSFVMSSGRGLYLVYLHTKINVSTKTFSHQAEGQALQGEHNQTIRREVVKTLINHFKSYGADQKCHDLVRLNKLPGGTHPKTGDPVRILDFDKVINKNHTRRSLHHLHKKFKELNILVDNSTSWASLGWLPRHLDENDINYGVEPKKPTIKPQGVKKTTTNKEVKVKSIKPKPVVKIEKPKKPLKAKSTKIDKDFQSHYVVKNGLNIIQNKHSLYMSRMEDLEYIARTRENPIGIRNSLLHLFSCSYKLAYGDINPSQLIETIKQINNLFKEPMEERDLQSLFNQVQRDDLFYFYKNDTIIRLLEIEGEEMKKLKTIISREEKNRRDAYQKRQSRRNEQGLTERQQTKLDNMKAVASMLDKGYKQKQIGEELGLSKGRISQLVKEIKALK